MVCGVCEGSNELTPSCSNGLNMRPEPFKCSITPRSEEIRQTIEREGRQALEELSVYEGETQYKMSQFYQKPNPGVAKHMVKS